MDKQKIKSLISLVDDQDQSVYDLVHEQILDLGGEILPLLNDAFDDSETSLMTNRLKELITQVALINARDEMREWKNENSRNLYQGLSIIAKFQYPKLNLEKINQSINKIRQELWLEVNDNMTALEKIRILNHLFFDIHGFRGDSKDYFAPENSFLNDVVIRKKGNPIMLSSLYSIVAQSANIPIYGVNMPNHFILAYTDRLYSQPLSDIKLNDILFYVNPFNLGEIYSLKEMRHFLTSMKVVPRDNYLLPCANTTIVYRNLNNLIHIYTKLGKKDLAASFQSIMDEL